MATKQEIKIASLERKLRKQKELEEKRKARLIERANRKVKKLKKKASRPTMKQLRDKAWRLTSKIVRTREPFCYTCGIYIPVFEKRHAGHHWSQGAHGAAKYDLRNIHTQCASDNVFKSGNQGEYAYRLRKELGDEQYEDLYQLAHTAKKWTRDELEQLIEERTKMLNELTCT
jgi:ribosome-binding ATPase YchF (GTP1/OBG family)